MIDQRRHKGPPGDRVRPERVDAAAAKDAEDWGRGDQRPGGVLLLLFSLSSDPAFPLGQIAADRQDLLPPPGPVRQGLGAFLRLALPLVAGDMGPHRFREPLRLIRSGEVDERGLHLPGRHRGAATTSPGFLVINPQALNGARRNLIIDRPAAVCRQRGANCMSQRNPNTQSGLSPVANIG